MEITNPLLELIPSPSPPSRDDVVASPQINKLEQKTKNIKQETISSLQTNLQELTLAIQERQAWLAGGAVGGPKFSNTYTARYASVIKNADAKVAAKLSSIDEQIARAKLSKDQRALIASIKQRGMQEIHNNRQTTTEEFHRYITTNPIYAGISEKQMTIAKQDLESSIKSSEIRIIDAMHEQIAQVMGLVRETTDDSCRRTTVNPRADLNKIISSSARVDQYRMQSIKHHATLLAETKEEIDEEIAGFEAQIPALKRRKATDGMIATLRKDAKECAEKHADIKLKQLTRVISRTMRMMISEECEEYISRSIKLNNRVISLFSLYFTPPSLPSIPPIASPLIWGKESSADTELLDVIDSNFEQCDRDWSLFVSINKSYLEMLSMQKEHRDRMMRLYAISFVIDETRLDQTTVIEDDQDVEIEKLRGQRNDLLRDVRFLDERVKEKLKMSKVKKVNTRPNVLEPRAKISKETQRYMEFINRPRDQNPQIVDIPRQPTDLDLARLAMSVRSRQNRPSVL